MEKQTLVRLFVIAAACGVFVFFYPTTQDRQSGGQDDKNTLTFSNTQEWDPELYAQLSDEMIVVPDALSHITLPPPPANNSEETAEELEILHAMKAERTEEKLADIEREAELTTVPVGTYTYAELTNPENRPFTKYLFETILDEYDPVILNLKKQFDRIRPSHLDPTLETAIEVPGHPAYPSGHSSQTHLFALIMADLDPNNAPLYWKSADEVARNREVAGLHYPSDSEAGVLLAEQFYALLKDTLWYETALENAISEWE